MKLWHIGISALALASIGCNNSTTTDPAGSGTAKGAESNDGKKKLTIGIVFDSGGRGDKSFNDSAYAGLSRAMKEFGVIEKPVDSQKESDYETNLETLAEQEVDLILAVGISMGAAVDKVAPKYPDIKFAWVDGSVKAANVRGLLFKEEEGSFLAGYLAGLMTKSGKVGFIGGQQIPLIKKFEAGYFAGALTAKPDITLLPPKYTGSWNDAVVGKQSAKTLYSQGADVIFHASGGCGRGVFEAAKEANMFAIGVDSDQDYMAEGRILASMIKRVDEAVYSTIKDVIDGKFSGGPKIYDLKASGVGLSEMKFTKDLIGAEKLAKISDIKEAIIAGTIKPPTTDEELAAFKASR
ncbi:MAG: BMP family ABC transporter substrate-binding protein [Fimbriimonadaceae bacterium]